MTKARKEWITATQFHDVSDREVLNTVLTRAKSWGPLGVVILDLDSTLYEVAYRTFNILKDWLKSPESAPFSEAVSCLNRLDLSHVGYSLDDTFTALGLDLSQSKNQEALRASKTFWKKRFFSNDYLVHDRPYPGAPGFVQAVYETGVQIAYLTGRDEPNMGRATREALKRDGFPLNPERIHFFLKPQREGDDHTFKVDTGHEIKKLGQVVASFENEPKNVIGLHQIFPEAMHVFVETHCSDNEALPGKGLYRIRSFDGF